MTSIADFLRSKSPDRSVADLLADIIRKRILEGEYLPGMKLVETEITKLYGVSRGPVREALRRLIAEGLVEGIKHHSPVVRGVGKLMFKQMFEVRAILEGFAARRAAQHIGISGNAKWVAQQLKFWSGNRIRSDTSFVQANTEFHSGILRIADHEILGQQITQLAIPGYKAVFRPIMTDKDIALSCKQHVRVLTAIAEGDARSAEKIMIDHVMDTSERVTAFYDNALFDRRLRELERLKRED